MESKPKRLPKLDRHWHHFKRLHNSSHNRYLRMIDTWKRWFKVYPRGYTLDGEQSGLNFEKA